MRNPVTLPGIGALASAPSSLRTNPNYLTPSAFPPTHKYNYLLRPDSTTLTAAIQHCIDSDSPVLGLKIHSHILKIGYEPYTNTSLAIKLLVLHLKCDSLFYARRLLDEMPRPGLGAYNYLLNAYAKHGKVQESFDLLRRIMYSRCQRPDGFTFSLILKVWARADASVTDSSSNSNSLDDVPRQVHAQVVKCLVGDDVVLFATLIDSYAKCRRIVSAKRVYDRAMLATNVMCSTSLITGYFDQGCVEMAEEIFVSTPQKDVVIFNAMVEGYSKSAETARKSVGMYIEMQRLGFHPTISTFASVIGACSMLTASQTGQQVQARILKTKFFTDVKIGSALVDMYSKCGETDDARRVFDYMPEKNVFSWTSLMDGYGRNGKPREAIEIFAKMRREERGQANYMPNKVTFLSALSACSHAGLVDEGWQIFKIMTRDYSMKPQMEHYACMVDLLGRHGSIKQAWEFVKGMPEEPNSDVWAAVLNCSRLHGEVGMANVAADELIRSCHIQERPGTCVALSNALAEAGKWDEVCSVRELMEMRGISKDTGFSTWVGSEDGGLV